MFDSFSGSRWINSPPFPNYTFFSRFSLPLEQTVLKIFVLSFSRSNVGSVLVSKLSQQMQIENQLAFILYYANIISHGIALGRAKCKKRRLIENSFAGSL